MSDTDRHPFLSGLSKHRGAQPTCVVIFGASGDLAARKLLPALSTTWPSTASCPPTST
jgi:glucose-6-phosphate 1-dehydrogenase